MLEKQFQRTFFSQLDAMSVDEISQKIEAVETASKSFDRLSEAGRDSRFMLRHMRRIRVERLMQVKTLH